MRITLSSLALAALGPFLVAPSALAEPPQVQELDIAFSDDSCGHPLPTSLQIRITQKVQPDGAVHYWVDLTGAITNDSNGKAVQVQATRRFHDEPATELTRLGGLQVQFRAVGEGVLWHNSGWAGGPLSEELPTYELRGRWDGPTAGLPAPVCAYLNG